VFPQPCLARATNQLLPPHRLCLRPYGLALSVFFCSWFSQEKTTVRTSLALVRMPPKRDSGAGAGEEAKTGRWGVKIENDGQAEPELPGKPAEVLLHALLFRTIALALQHGTWHGVAWKSHQGTLARCSAGLLHWRMRAITSVVVCITAYLCTCVDMCVHARHTYILYIHIICMRRSCRSLAPCSPGLSVRVVLD